MVSRRFTQVNVFSPDPVMGNPLAVIHDAQGLSDDEMAAIARWTNLSETTFLLDSNTADYRVRIFTTTGELPFAGHPTLGSAHAWLAAGGTPAQPNQILQECGVGTVPIRPAAPQSQPSALHDASTPHATSAPNTSAPTNTSAPLTSELAFAAPDFLRTGEVDAADLATVTAALGVSPAHVIGAQWIDNGPGWLGLHLDSAATVLSLAPDYAALGDLYLGVIGAHAPGQSDADVEVRAFVADAGLEDPVTGSLNAGFAKWLIPTGVLPQHVTAAQGTVLGRRGRVTLDADGESIWVGGVSVSTVSGTITL